MQLVSANAMQQITISRFIIQPPSPRYLAALYAGASTQEAHLQAWQGIVS